MQSSKIALVAAILLYVSETAPSTALRYLPGRSPRHGAPLRPVAAACPNISGADMRRAGTTVSAASGWAYPKAIPDDWCNSIDANKRQMRHEQSGAIATRRQRSPETAVRRGRLRKFIGRFSRPKFQGPGQIHSSFRGSSGCRSPASPGGSSPGGGGAQTGSSGDGLRGLERGSVGIPGLSSLIALLLGW